MSVYFAQVGRYIKVGYSENPERRVRNLWKSGTRYGRPADCPLDTPRLLASIPGSLNREAECHSALADFAVGCEFFVDEPPVRDFIAAVVAGESIKHIARDSGPAFDGFDEQRDLCPEDFATLRRALDTMFASRPLGLTA